MRIVSKKTCDVLNDLIKVNNERIEGYSKAAAEAKNNASNLVSTFQDMITQSRNYITALGNLVTKYGGSLADGAAMGKIYRTWADLQINFSEADRKNILNACEFGEDAAQKAYKKALEEIELGEEARSLIAMQKNALKDAHDLVRYYRDRARVHA